MYIQLLRLRDDDESTVGTVSVDGKFRCFSLEDTHNEPKVYGKTCIPSGTYNILLRTEGGMTGKYVAKYGKAHKGMLWLQDVNNFKYVYIHTGNNADHTDGCILIGNSCNMQGRQSVGNSVSAYKPFYKEAVEALERGEEVTIQII